MKKLYTILAMLLLLGSVSATQVVDNCWLEQKECVKWGFFSCKEYDWVQGDCNVEPERYEGEWCRLQCDYTDVEEFDENEYYDKGDISGMFGDTYDYMNSKYYKKGVVDKLFVKHWKMKQRIKGVENYISDNEKGWNKDVVGGGGISYPRAEKMIQTAINSLKLWVEETFFAQNLRLEALENAVSEIDEIAFCRGKATVMIEYNLPYIECNGIIYRNVNGRGLAVIPV